MKNPQNFPRSITVRWFDGCPLYSVRISKFLGEHQGVFVYQTEDGCIIQIRRRSLQRFLGRHFIYPSEIQKPHLPTEVRGYFSEHLCPRCKVPMICLGRRYYKCPNCGIIRKL